MELAPPEDLYVPVSGEVRLRARHWPGAGLRPFLLVHGLLSNARLWDEVAARLAAEGHPVYAVDLRAHGGSDAPESGYDTPTMASDLADAGAALGLTGALVAGHSWGGHVCLRLAAEHPRLVAGLALVDGGWVDTVETVGSAQHWHHAERAMVGARASHTALTTADMRAYLRGVHPTWSPAAVEAHLSDLRVGPDGSLVPRLTEAQFMSIVWSLRDEPPARWHRSISVPVVLLPAIPSVESDWTRRLRDWVEAARQAMPRATVSWYPGGDHYLHAEAPDRVAGDLLGLAEAVGSPVP
ncbi:alpha/beta fold hydrolase [Actinomadura macra]|uniref:alpha/beta fold hydrolase n=1 Tax=Actinomadura macra TaxID=46164 RepID=UPI000833C5F8|nr:alpha/beta hydrolase [Actinomadura macra]